MTSVQWIFIGMLLLGGGERCRAEVRVERLLVAQRPGSALFDIHYDLYADARELTVELVISDGEEPVSAASARGAVGPRQSAGTDQLIVWDASADYGLSRLSTNMTFTVRALPVRPEQGDPSAVDWLVIDERWVRNMYADGAATISDLETGLMWVFDAAGNGTAPWRVAIQQCDALSYAGYDNWFLPNKQQLLPLFDVVGYFEDVQPERYWTRTPNYSYADSVNMLDGRAKYDYPSRSRWIWPCRLISGEEFSP